MSRHLIVFAAAIAAVCFVEPCAAQMGPGQMNPAQGAVPSNADSMQSRTLDLINSEVFRQKREKLGLTAEQMQAQDKAVVTNLVNSVQFPCSVTNAQLLLEGNETIDGKIVKTKIYEAACGNGLGYFLVGRGQQGRPSGHTCFAADATKQADLIAHRTPDLVCTLPENLDVKTIATNILLRKGMSCVVRDVRWVGISAKSNTDYTEIACNDGNGFILASPLPGSNFNPQVVRCHDAALQGTPCKLSDNGQIITLQTFKDALAQHQVSCDALDERVIGKEALAQRHVVEFACTQHPEGLVAYIPLNGNTAPFETLDCAAAAKRGVACKLKQVK